MPLLLTSVSPAVHACNLAPPHRLSLALLFTFLVLCFLSPAISLLVSLNLSQPAISSPSFPFAPGHHDTSFLLTFLLASLSKASKLHLAPFQLLLSLPILKPHFSLLMICKKSFSSVAGRRGGGGRRHTTLPQLGSIWSSCGGMIKCNVTASTRKHWSDIYWIPDCFMCLNCILCLPWCMYYISLYCSFILLFYQSVIQWRSALFNLKVFPPLSCTSLNLISSLFLCTHSKIPHQGQEVHILVYQHALWHKLHGML